MKKTHLLLVLSIFALLLFYLHQKIQIYAVAFEVSKSYDDYQLLASQRDYLGYRFSKRTSLSEVSQWVVAENFSAPGKERLLAFRPYPDTDQLQVARQKSFFERLRIPASISDVFARER